MHTTHQHRARTRGTAKRRKERWVRPRRNCTEQDWPSNGVMGGFWPQSDGVEYIAAPRVHVLYMSALLTKAALMFVVGTSGSTQAPREARSLILSFTSPLSLSNPHRTSHPTSPHHSSSIIPRLRPSISLTSILHALAYIASSGIDQSPWCSCKAP